jgi:hypothetical protein
MSNLLPEQEKKAILSMYRKRYSIVFLFYISGVIVVSSVLLLPSYFLSKVIDTASIEKKATVSARETIGVQASLTKLVANINARLDVFNTVQPRSPIVDGFIDPVLAVKTEGVHILTLTYTVVADKKTTASIQIGGSAADRQALLTYADSLKKIPNITNVNVPLSSFIKDQNVPFAITATLSIQ